MIDQPLCWCMRYVRIRLSDIAAQLADGLLDQLSEGIDELQIEGRAIVRDGAGVLPGDPEKVAPVSESYRVIGSEPDCLAVVRKGAVILPPDDIEMPSQAER